MTTLSISTRELPAANLAQPSPHACLETAGRHVVFGDTISAEDREHANHGCLYSPLPYCMQDNYDRQRTTRQFPVAVLENNLLRAEFLLEQGGRLWSLFDKRANRELLYVNPVFQPANLALRNAWFSGGVEWNMGMPAHHPFTCDKTFVAALHDPDRGPILRMWEYERIRGSIFQLDFYIPIDSPLLHVRCRLSNPNANSRPAYWFSNMAVPMTGDTRVVVPADFAYSTDYVDGHHTLQRIPVPTESDDIDNSYPSQIPNARDMFYRIDVPQQQPWIAALDAQGRGLFQASTAELKGRKMFVWGTSTGGERWQEFLSVPGSRYLEIQAGYGRTQAECVPMQPFQSVEWLEVYGLMQADPGQVRSADWSVARETLETKVRELAPLERLEQELLVTREMADKPPAEILQHGSGWGAIECKRRKRDSTVELASASTPFPAESITNEEQLWADLLDLGLLTAVGRGPGTPGGYMADNSWIPILEESLLRTNGDNWSSRLHLGVLYYANGDSGLAKEHWMQSVEHQENAFAYRNLAFAAAQVLDEDSAATYYRAALSVAPDDYRVAQEYLELLLNAERHQEFVGYYATASSSVLASPRVQMARARYAFAVGDLGEAEKTLENILLPDLREGDNVLTDIWYQIQAQKLATHTGVECNEHLLAETKRSQTPPPHLDFRMSQ